jgi:membrane protease YdiL (CAAX protease family)
MTEPIDRALARQWFYYACVFELVLLLVGAALLVWLPLSTSVRFHWRTMDVGWSILGVAPLLGLLAWTVRSRSKVIRQIPQFLDTMARPILERWKVLELAAISVLAGVGEELIFRGVLQGGVGQWLSPSWGLAVASLVFGACHLVTPAYGVIAAVIGLYLGLLLNWSQNLLVPALTHALYDFIALVYFARLREPPG